MFTQGHPLSSFHSQIPLQHGSSLSQHKMGSLQDLPHVDMMKPITKMASGVFSTERIADMVSMAARESFSGAFGPSYLEIPRDILDREIEVSSAVIPKPGGPACGYSVWITLQAFIHGRYKGLLVF